MAKDKNNNGDEPIDDGQESFAFEAPIEIVWPTARRTDPETSHEAAASFTKKRLGDIQQDVLGWYRKVKRADDEQLEDNFAAKYHAQTTVSKRRTDLVKLGYLEWSGEWRVNRNNRRMRIWQLVDRKKKLKSYIQRPPREGVCDRCGEEKMCSIYEGPMEEDNGYIDEISVCEACDDTDDPEDRG